MPDPNAQTPEPPTPGTSGDPAPAEPQPSDEAEPPDDGAGGGTAVEDDLSVRSAIEGDTAAEALATVDEDDRGPLAPLFQEPGEPAPGPPDR